MKTYFARGVLSLFYYLFWTFITFAVMKDSEPSAGAVWLAGLAVSLAMIVAYKVAGWLIDTAFPL